MKNVELNNETWFDFQERCRWHINVKASCKDGCTKGLNADGYAIYSCAEFYCPRLKKEVEVTPKTNPCSEIIL